jgi:CRP/FNR family transcriptional regulator, cyclic AMP receptor protein
MEPNTCKKLRQFFKKYPLKTYKKGELICSPRIICDRVGLMKSGHVRLYTKPRNGQEITNVNIAKPVFTMTIVNTLSGNNLYFYFEALTPCEIWFAPSDDVITFLKENPDVNYPVMRYFLNSLSNFIYYFGLLKTGSAIEKVASTLQLLASNYGHKEKSGDIYVAYPSTHRIIASVIGLTRETVSLQMINLQKKGIIDAKRDHFIIKKIKELKKIAG